MRCQYYISSYGIISFFEDSFADEVKIEELISLGDFYKAYFVFQKCVSEENIKEIHQISSKLSHIQISLLDNAIEKIDVVHDFFKENHNISIVASIADYYRVHTTCNVKVGYEFWNDYDIPTGLRELTDNIKKTCDIACIKDKIEKIIDEILPVSTCSELEKIILTDIWFQRNVQYISGPKSTCEDIIYYCPDIKRESANDDVILNRFGRCEDIAFTAALILNHPKMNIKCRMVGASRSDGFNHAWNMIDYNEKVYYFDFTRNITRNPEKVPQTLKAMSYWTNYTLLGEDKAETIYGKCIGYDSNRISLESFSEEEKKKCIRNLSEEKQVPMLWGKSVVQYSYSRSISDENN